MQPDRHQIAIFDDRPFFERAFVYGVIGEACRDDDSRAAAKELEHDLRANLHAAAGDERHAAAQVAELGAFGEVQIAAPWAHGVVEEVHLGIRVFANVAKAITFEHRLRGGHFIDDLI